MQQTVQSTRARVPRFLPETVFCALAALFSLLWILQFLSIWHRHPASDWNSSEWMISYSGGFTRRGLSGSALMAALRVTGWSFAGTWITGTTVLALAVSAWFARQVARAGNRAIWRTALLLNPLLFLSAIQAGTFLRKDLLFAAATILHVWYAQRVARQPARARMAAYVLSLAALSTALALVHEGIFLFAWLPVNCLVAGATLPRMAERRRTAAVLLLAMFAPSLAATAACVVFHGNAEVAAAIVRAWKPLMPPNYSTTAPLPPEVEELGSNVSHTSATVVQGMRQWPIFVLIAAMGGAVYVAAIQRLVPGSDVRRVLLLLTAMLVAALPLFVLGMDWGRWFCILGCSSFPVLVCPSLLTAGSGAAAPRSGGWVDAISRRVERYPFVLVLVLLFCPLAPWPCPAPLLAYNPIFLLLSLGSKLWGPR